MMRISANTLPDLYRKAAEQFSELPAFAAKNSSGSYQAISYRQLYEDGLSLATALIDLGLRQREHVGLLSDNRPEWILCDYGILIAGCADVPRGADITGNELGYILNHSDSRFVFVEDSRMLEKLEHVRRALQAVEKIVVMDSKHPVPSGTLGLKELVERGWRSPGGRAYRENTPGRPFHRNLHLGHNRNSKGRSAYPRQHDFPGA